MLCRLMPSHGGSASSESNPRWSASSPSSRLARWRASSEQRSPALVSTSHSSARRTALSLALPTMGFWPTTAMNPIRVTTLAARVYHPTVSASAASVVTR